tara:strand:+ start:84 stop:611 length:528 start_codon:yes stop_codon:yes gene_type:complete
MSSVLIVYSSTDGHTKIICQRITNFLNEDNLVKLLPLEDAKKIDLSNFEKIIIGASIRYGKHSKELYKFVNLNKNILDQKKSAFFSVNVVARKPEKNTAETNPYINKFLKISKWKPDIIKVFAGKVDYPSYNFFDKYVIKFIMFITKGPTDTSRSYEFTDWSKVDEFSKEFKNIY